MSLKSESSNTADLSCSLCLRRIGKAAMIINWIRPSWSRIWNKLFPLPGREEALNQKIGAALEQISNICCMEQCYMLLELGGADAVFQILSFQGKRTVMVSMDVVHAMTTAEGFISVVGEGVLAVDVGIEVFVVDAATSTCGEAQTEMGMYNWCLTEFPYEEFLPAWKQDGDVQPPMLTSGGVSCSWQWFRFQSTRRHQYVDDDSGASQLVVNMSVQKIC